MTRTVPRKCGEASVAPHSDPINLHLLRKHRSAIGIADEVSANCNVEQNEEWRLKLRRAVYSARDVGLRILDPIDVPLDCSRRTGDGERVEARRQRSGRIEDPSE